MQGVSSQFVLYSIIIVAGYLAKRLRILHENDGEALSRAVLRITFPALVINTICNVKIEPSFEVIPLMSAVYSGLMILLSIILFKNESRKLKGTIVLSMTGFNAGLFGFPIIEGIWGKEGLKYLALFDIGNALGIFIFSYAVASFFSSEENSFNLKHVLVRLLGSIPMISYIVALTINLLGVRLPEVVLSTTGILSKANTPIILILIGFYLNFSVDKSCWRKVLKILLIRYTMGLAMGITIYFVLPFNNILKSVLLAAFILPLAASSIPFSVELKLDQKLTGAILNIANVISYVILWILISILNMKGYL